RDRLPHRSSVCGELPPLLAVQGRRSRPHGAVHGRGAAMTVVVTERLELPIEGMTCASCAARIERKLNKLDGVTASVNYATEKAAVEYDPSQVTPDALLDAVEQVGYSARLPKAVTAAAEEDPTAALRRRLIFSAVLA